MCMLYIAFVNVRGDPGTWVCVDVCVCSPVSSNTIAVAKRRHSRYFGQKLRPTVGLTPFTKYMCCRVFAAWKFSITYFI